MATGFNTSGLTLNPQEVQFASEFIVTATIEAPDISTIHNVVEGITQKEQIILAGKLGLTGTKKTACGVTGGGQTVPLTQKYWDPALVEEALDICVLELPPMLKAYRNKVAKYEDYFNAGFSDLDKLLTYMFSLALKESIWRISWLGNTSVPTAGAGSAGLLDAANAKYFNQINGFFYQLINGSYQKVTISENAQTTKALQLTLADGAAEAYFKQILAKAPRELRKRKKDSMLLVSHAIYQNYYDGLINTGKASDITLVENGLTAVTFDGIPVIDMDDTWDRDIQTYFAQTSADLAYDNPNRIVYTVPENIPIGVASKSDFDNIKTWFNEETEKLWIKNGFSMDAKVISDELIVYGI